ncbi:PA14 domain-containing protein [Flavobacterium gillisiae]|uniref:PA14 domain-containing protein n=1 Tax=Flavobacterium gillisiae TaxID=150146 RepID=A0A1H3YTA3_9FLAO|nr:PA14 domain-containing protein [Flavobacterium gillisiae]SEA14795.1 PA14 domain-containing protein [Flavobacterium gillisiae]
MNKILLLVNKRMLFCILCLIISSVSFGQTTLFQYDFEGSANPNINNTVGTPSIAASNGLTNIQFSTNNTCNTGNSSSLSSTSWRTNDYYLFVVNTTGYENLEFSYCNDASNTRIGDFQVYVSPDKGNSFSSVINNYTAATTGSTKTSTQFPASSSDNSEVWILIYKTNNSDNNNRVFYIDNVTLKGCPTSAGNLSGNQYICTYGTKTTTLTSTVSGGTWSSSNNSIATVNSTTGVINAVGVGTATISYTITSTSCTTRTVTRLVYVANSPSGAPTISGTPSTAQCQSSTATYTINALAGASGYVWSTSATGWTIVPASDGLSAVITFGSNAVSGNFSVKSTNGCDTTGASGSPVTSPYVFISQSSFGGNIPSTASGCANSYITNLGLTGQTGNPIRWESSTNNFVSTPTTIATTANNINVSNLTQTTYYRAVVQNSPCTNIAYSNVCTVTISPLPVAAGTISGTATVCQGQSSVSYSVPVITNATSYSWAYSGAGATISGTTNNPTITFATNATSGNLTVYGVNACGSGTISPNYPIAVTATTAPTVGTITQPTCSVATGSVALSGLPSGSWLLTQSPGSTTTTGSGTSTTVSGLSTGTYTYAVTSTNNGTGLIGDYFNNMNLSGSPTLTRTDATVNFNWGNGSPDPSIPIDGFSVRWWGLIQAPTTGSYTFSTVSDDGIRLWVNGVQVINNWTNHASTTDTGSITLTEGVKYNIVLEFFENGGQAVSTLSWSYPGQGLQIIPQSQLFPSAGCSPVTSSNVVINAKPAAAPSAPIASAGTAATCTQITANWSASANATGYYLDVSTVSTFATLVTGYSNLDVSNVTIKNVTGLTAGTTYYYRVRAYNTCGTSVSSGTIIYASSPVTSITSQSTAAQTKCIGSVFSPITVTASGTGLTYQWYSNTSNSNSGGASLSSVNGAQTNSYTPQSTVSGTLYYYCIITGTCGSSVTSLVSGAFITNGNTGISSESTATQTKCIGSAFLAITVTASGTGLTYQWYSNASNSNTGGTSLALANGAQTNSYTPQSTVSGTLYYYCIITGTCGSSVTSLISGAFITNPIPAVPSVGTVTQPDCVISKGSVVLSGLPTSGTITQTGTSTSSYAITGTVMTISGLATGTYKFSASNGSCASVATGNVVMNSAVTNTWNGTVWSNGTPTLSDKIVFSGNYPLASDPNVDIEGCSCKVTGSTTVVFKAGRTLKIKNEIDVQPSGTLTFESGASLVQINDTPSTPNSGDIIYKRETTSISNFDYTYWSSPVASQTLYNLSPNTLGDKFYSFDSGIDNWRQENSASTMAIGTGYIVRGPQNYSAPTPPSVYLASFIGVPNNGVKNTAIGVAGNSNLIGNPYPSALDADSFLTANNGVIEGTIYFWTHNTNIGIGVSNPGSGTYAYSSDDYASYNLTGGVATQAPSSSNAGAVNSNAPSGKIASGQAFFTTSIASGNAVFNNSMRVGGGTAPGNNSQFFKNASNTKAVTTVEKDRLWLNLYNMQDAFKQTLVGYVTGATNEYDSAFDGESFDSNEFLDFYSINQDKNLVIQGRALPFDQADQVPLGYSSTIVGDFQIGIGQVDGSFVDKDVFLEDKLLNTTHNLKMDPYLFKTESGVFNNRFIIKYTNKTLTIDDFDDVKNGVLVSSKNKEIQIKSSNELIDKVVVFDFSGRQLYSKTKIAASDYKIQTLIRTDQGLIVKVVLQNGQIVSKKIIF